MYTLFYCPAPTKLTGLYRTVSTIALCYTKFTILIWTKISLVPYLFSIESMLVVLHCVHIEHGVQEGFCFDHLFIQSVIPLCTARYFGSHKQSKLRGTQCKGRNSVVKSSQVSWAGQYKKCVQHDFKFSSEYSEWTCFAMQALLPKKSAINYSLLDSQEV